MLKLNGLEIYSKDNTLYFKTLYNTIKLDIEDLYALLRICVDDTAIKLYLGQDYYYFHIIKDINNWVLVIYDIINGKGTTHNLNMRDIDFLKLELLKCKSLEEEIYYKQIQSDLLKTYKDLILTLRG